MNTKTIVLSPAALEFLEAQALRGLVEAAAELQGLEPKKEPASYAEAYGRVRAGVLALADIWSGEDFDGMLPLYVAKYHSKGVGHSFAEQQAMIDGGLDPAKEFGPYDPRASTPRCVHGLLFTEDCTRCAEPLALEKAQ